MSKNAKTADADLHPVTTTMSDPSPLFLVATFVEMSAGIFATTRASFLNEKAGTEAYVLFAVYLGFAALLLYCIGQDIRSHLKGYGSSGYWILAVSTMVTGCTFCTLISSQFTFPFGPHPILERDVLSALVVYLLAANFPTLLLITCRPDMLKWDNEDSEDEESGKPKQEAAGETGRDNLKGKIPSSCSTLDMEPTCDVRVV
ncbi:unnamed protein product [Orchesella dallaii]|uniref:Uncharacterized protein n=1 Tax=Orchesella dallaii TaxID=48710 RepID=A0ABP1RV27_9HEXA